MTERIAFLLFCAAGLMMAFAYGVGVGRFEVYPYQPLRDAYVTTLNLMDRVSASDANVSLLGFSDMDAGAAASARFGDGGGSFSQPLLVYGGKEQFLELCPEAGCLAVKFDGAGDPLRAYPFRPDEIFAARAPGGAEFESFDSDFGAIAHPVGMALYPDGDLLVTFHGDTIFPFAVGAARVDPDGRPRWFRADYSHHWPKLLDDGRALVPAMDVSTAPVEVEIGAGKRVVLECGSGKPYVDTVRLIDGDGRPVREWSVLDALLDSPFRAVLQHTTDPCDPVHLNYIDVVPEEAASAMANVEAGDLVVSLRNISAFGFLDREDGHLKRLVRGTFVQQHSVQHWRDGTFLLFDNHGGDLDGGSSRVLALDLTSGQTRTVFPGLKTSEEYRGIFSDRAGKISIGPDQETAIVAYSGAGRAYEVRLSDGEVLAEYRHLHDLSSVGDLPDEAETRAANARLYGVDFIDEAAQGDETKISAREVGSEPDIISTIEEPDGTTSID